MKTYLYRSIGLHLTALLLIMIDLPFFSRKPAVIGQAPIIVDLQDVKLAEMTNLPPKAVFGEEEKKATAPEEKKPTPNWTREETPKSKTEPQQPDVQTPKKDFLDTSPAQEEKPTPKPSSKPKPKPKPIPKPAPKPQRKPTPQPKPAPQKPKTQTPAPEKPKTIANPLKSLMDSVNSLEKEIGKETAPAVIKTGTQVANTGIEGGTGGSYFSELSITETDAIAGRLRECWNLDPGARGIENMVVELRAYLDRNGNVTDVKILDSGRAGSDPAFRTVAESARRAVYSCMNKNGVNIYKIFPEKYADKYNLWNTLLLRFNPMDASIK